MKEKNLAHLILRKIISKLANLTPGVVYYPTGWPAKINDVLRVVGASRDSAQTPMTTAAVSMACAMHEHMNVGDAAEIQLTGVTRGDDDVGSFIINVKRI